MRGREFNDAAVRNAQARLGTPRLDRHERRGSTLFAALWLGVMFIALLSLGGLRLYGLFLEQRLAIVSQRIEKVVDMRASLEERRSALLSPARIYGVARSELKMVSARDVQVVHVDESVMLASTRRSEPRPDTMSMRAELAPGVWETITSFVMPAYADE